MTVLAVALAGGFGAALRFVIDGLIGRVHRGTVPLGTVVINVTGSFLLGLITGLALDHLATADLRLLLGTGLLGGYTTFSTASVEGRHHRLDRQHPAVLTAAAHAAAMLVISMTAAALGWWLA